MNSTENPSMTTIATPRFAELTGQLFIDDERTRAVMRQKYDAMTPAEQNSLFGPATDYQEFYNQAKDIHLAVSRETANLMYMLARSMGAVSVVEFGTSFGVSTLHLAAALKDNGGGRVITSEFEPSKVDRARANFEAAGLADLIDLRAGDALDTLARDLPDQIDLVLLDGAKQLYPRILALLESRIRIGGLIVADNADMCPEYLVAIRDPKTGYLSVPFGEDVELSQKLR
jgi:predicted O-methyltransferase YrrM